MNLIKTKKSRKNYLTEIVDLMLLDVSFALVLLVISGALFLLCYAHQQVFVRQHLWMERYCLPVICIQIVCVDFVRKLLHVRPYRLIESPIFDRPDFISILSVVIGAILIIAVCLPISEIPMYLNEEGLLYKIIQSRGWRIPDFMVCAGAFAAPIAVYLLGFFTTPDNTADDAVTNSDNS